MVVFFWYLYVDVLAAGDNLLCYARVLALTDTRALST